ncbi:ABC transporter ATP-binding protein [Anaerocolumna sp. AGMB13025]|uniref:ABC transporter ATP-binding protein n=1 Tax=Anaerocolumna sp. AGMB13025 TaxID=3039116 RepID=UPI00241F669B|nr:ABC transporter ATP-binding protein [Anaerocolumna sp. AGMB13025]WFR58660.1 ABC transporter ATP-binding protein [Anaerocolumna sp. AGMB13025]
MEKIQLSDISFAYEGTVDGGVKNINLSISAGQCVVLTGQSGCGKTTITRLINGLIPEFFKGELKGNIVVDGEDLFAKKLYEIARTTGSVFQNPKTQFFNTDTDGEIAFGLENRGIERSKIINRVKQTAEDLKVTNLLNRSIFSLSGGEKQKIAFASVYATNPDIYILDEPSSNLDTNSISDLAEYIQIIKKQGKTVVIAEHRLYYLTNLADEIYYMEHGEIKYKWTQSEFLKLSDYERELLGLRSFLYKEPQICTEVKEKKKTVLEVRDLSIGYGKKVVHSHINLTAAKGDIIAVTGHNGVGKSTFLRTICGLQKPLEGAVIWNGAAQSEKKLIKRAYMVMQDVNYQLFADSVEHETHFGIKNPDLDKVEKTLKELGLYQLKDEHPNTLSGGQKQRIAVAVSMICDKEVLVFDEPSSGLDLESMRVVSELIKDLAKADKIILVVTHDSELISQTCNRLFQLGGS